MDGCYIRTYTGKQGVGQMAGKVKRKVDIMADSISKGRKFSDKEKQLLASMIRERKSRDVVDRIDKLKKRNKR